MTNNNRVVVALSFALVGAATSAVRLVRITKEERKKRDRIKASSEEEMRAIAYARAVMLDRIEHGEYVHKSLTEVQNDLEFERIVYFLK